MRSSYGALALAMLFTPAVGLAQTSAAETPLEKPPTAEAAPAPSPAAKEPAVSSPFTSHRELAGHIFIPSHLVLDPFSNTSFGMSLATGVGSAEGAANIQVDPTTGAITKSGTASYPFSAAGPELELSIRLWEFLSVRLGTVAFLFSGTTGDAALVVGSGFQFGGNVGLTAGLNLGDHVRAAFTFDLVSSPRYNLLVLAGISDAIASGQPPTGEELLEKTNTLTLEPGLAAAWAPWRFIGGTLNFQYLHPQKTGASSSALNGLALALLIDFDLMSLVPEVPLGFTATYKWTAPIGADGVTSAQDVGGGIFYTGHPDLALGVEVAGRRFTLQNSLKADATLVTITLRYYW